MLPGQSATLTLSSAKYPCKPTITLTCIIPCVTTTTPNFPLITQTYCVGNTISNLSNISPNGISGTWSPSNVISNVASGTYIFTPDPILFPCALTQTLNVTVNPIATPSFFGIACKHLSKLDRASFTIKFNQYHSNYWNLGAFSIHKYNNFGLNYLYFYT